MTDTPGKARCKGCEAAGDPARSKPLPDGWSLKHYESKEGFFGWLALQTVKHRCTLRDLDGREARALGPTLKRLEKGIYEYWRRRKHPVDRVYVMYFLEGQLERDPKNKWHLHLHLVPRFRDFAQLMLKEDGTIDAYRVARLYLRPALPSFLNRRAFKLSLGADKCTKEDLKIVTGVIARSRFS